ncbi:ribonuclease J [Brevibacterium sp. BRM-1]|uniref:ribonuclease J n=1 Tax=Brevibacterium sp. BRM-1 TaxID=2999062 RepID=UPI00227F5D33|nr:ribonuclease J [Brevibacterium sp. BRM-1]WAL41612.1 ribonuclease J [Brevibacterium sp. BRM-1]
MRIVALGGLGEVGRNMTVFEYRGKILIVDCGVLFPEEEQPGVDLILPDLSYLDGRMNDIVGVVLTHGHEDHIGAVPYLLKRRNDIPLLGSTLTLALIEAKLKEHRIKPVTRVVREGETDQLGPFDLEFVAVNHSIPDALAVAIKTGAGTVLHTGDFKMDQLPLDRRITDLRSFARLGEEGVDLFLTDSTNAEVPGFTSLERNIGPVLETIFGKADRRIIVASFSSHVHRVQQVLEAASAHGRKVALVGRSMVRNMKIAQELGYLHVPDGVLIDIKDVDKLPDDQVVLMCTGSQGEPMAALSRMANGTHRVEVGEDDTIVLASSLIPGNENAVFRVINGLMRLGAKVVHKGNANVHVSGHASGGELLYAYNIVKPKGVMPVHGEWRHLLANAKHAADTGVPEENIVIADDGWVVDLKDGRARVVGAVECDYVFVDGSSIGTITESDLEDRRVLAGEGFVSIVTTVRPEDATIITGPVIKTRGVAEEDSVFDWIQPKIAEAITEAMQEGVKDEQNLQQVIRRTIGRWISSKLRRRPMIVPTVIVVDREGREIGGKPKQLESGRSGGSRRRKR